MLSPIQFLPASVCASPSLGCSGSSPLGEFELNLGSVPAKSLTMFDLCRYAMNTLRSTRNPTTIVGWPQKYAAGISEIPASSEERLTYRVAIAATKNTASPVNAVQG